MSTTVALDFKPYLHQKAAHAMLGTFRFLVLVWHRRAGKTVFAVVELILAALRCKKERGRYGYVAPFLKQAKAVAWDYLRHFALAIPGCIYNESELSVALPNGAKVRLFGADNPDSLRGQYFDGIVLDEVADMKPSVWGEIIRPALTDRQGWALFIGTPKGVNLFSELYFNALKGQDGWSADLRRASDTGVIPKEELEHAKTSMSASQFAQEMDCDFAAAVDNALILLDDVRAAMDRTLAEHQYNFAAKVLGVDVARYGVDANVAIVRQGLAAFNPESWAGLDTMATASQVARIIDTEKPHATFIDVGGVGGGVVDRLTQLGFSVVGIYFGSSPVREQNENKRAEMWRDMAAWIRAGARLPKVERLAQDLTAPTYSYANARGRFQLESKDDMRDRGLPSPDYGDALCLTFAQPVPIPEHGRYVTAGRGHAQTDYDPFQERV